jgi:multidrug efflux pump subunit AcrA (membrane-fusion protein)/YHS domain-containing protein
LADVFEYEAQFFKPGSKATVWLPYQKKKYQATVSEVLPIFDPATRTLKVRLETDNPGFILRPDMYVDVELPIKMPPAITVPADAILNSGLRKAVFVDKGNGFFEQRRVETGYHLGDRVEITGGLVSGERIVTSGNFFVDSESRLQLAAQGIYGEMSLDPVCGTGVDETRARSTGEASVYRNKTYSFCSTKCKERFDKSPDRYARP